MKKSIPTIRKLEGNEKKAFPQFGNRNQRLSFLGMDGNGNFRSPLARPFHLMTWAIWAVPKIYYYKYFLFGQKVEAYMSKRGGWGLNYLSSWRLDNLSEKGRQIILNTTDG